MMIDTEGMDQGPADEFEGRSVQDRLAEKFSGARWVKAKIRGMYFLLTTFDKSRKARGIL